MKKNKKFKWYAEHNLLDEYYKKYGTRWQKLLTKIKKTRK